MMPKRPPTHGQDLRRLRDKAREMTPARKLYDHRWAEYSKQYRIAHPLCCDPLGLHPGVPTPAECVDHIIAHKGNEQLFWDPNNHQPVCLNCNTAKANKEEGGFGR